MWPWQEAPWDFSIPTTAPSSDVSLFPLAGLELWIHTHLLPSFGQALAFPSFCPHPSFATEGIWCPPAPVTPCASPPWVVWELRAAPSLSQCQPTLQGGDKPELRGEFRGKQMDTNNSPVVFLESRFPKAAAGSSRSVPFPSHAAVALSQPGCPSLAQPPGMSAGHSGLLPAPTHSGHAQMFPHCSLWSCSEKQREARPRQPPAGTCSTR